MTTVDLESTATCLVADGKGILAADETPGTLTKRFEKLSIQSLPIAETICGLGNRKNELVKVHMASRVQAYPGSVAFLGYVRRFGIKTAVVTSSQNCQTVLRAAKKGNAGELKINGAAWSSGIWRSCSPGTSASHWSPHD